MLRYHVPNEKLYPEKYAHHLLLLFYPFRNELELLCNKSYAEMLSHVNVLNPICTGGRGGGAFHQKSL